MRMRWYSQVVEVKDSVRNVINECVRHDGCNRCMYLNKCGVHVVDSEGNLKVAFPYELKDIY